MVAKRKIFVMVLFFGIAGCSSYDVRTDRLLIEKMEKNPQICTDRFILPIKIGPIGSSTAVTFTQDASGFLKTTGSVEYTTGGGKNLFGYGAIHRWKGTVKRVKFQNVNETPERFTFISDKNDLLTFGCVRGVGYVYLHGKGKVILQSGEEVRLGY